MHIYIYIYFYIYLYTYLYMYIYMPKSNLNRKATISNDSYIYISINQKAILIITFALPDLLFVLAAVQVSLWPGGIRNPLLQTIREKTYDTPKYPS